MSDGELVRQRVARSALESGDERLESAYRIAVNGVMKLRHATALVLLLVASNAFALTGQQYLSQAASSGPQARHEGISG